MSSTGDSSKSRLEAAVLHDSRLSHGLDGRRATPGVGFFVPAVFAMVGAPPPFGACRSLVGLMQSIRAAHSERCISTHHYAVAKKGCCGATANKGERKQDLGSKAQQ